MNRIERYPPADRFAAILSDGCSGLITNLDTSVATLRIGKEQVPVTLNEGTAPTCYICCPSVAYIDYALDELRNFDAHPALKTMLSGLIRAGRPLLRISGLDHQIQLNNWLLSTNPAPRWTAADIRQTRDELTTAHPARAIVIRSLNTLADAETLENFRAAGFTLIPARQVYLFDGQEKRRETRDQKRDRALLRNVPFRRVRTNDVWSTADYDRAARLYHLLYCRKYTPLNPQYSGTFIAAMHRAGLIEIEGLRTKDGELIAFSAWFTRGKTLTQPLVGYDTTAPQELGLYRMLMQMGQAKAQSERLFFNMSAGAAAFKRNRGAVPAIEYSAVYVDHLGRKERLAVRMLERLLCRVGIPILQRFEL